MNGFNTENGYVARFTGIDPGVDGEIELIQSDGGSADPPREYINALMVRAVDSSVQVELTSRVTTGSDDAEEDRDTGVVSLNSSDLELTNDRGSDQIVGVRFADLAIPSQARIVSASVQFTVDKVSTGLSSLTIAGEASGNARSFQSDSGDLSGRVLTTATVAWNPGNWDTVGDAGPDQQTPDLTPVVQEVVDEPGWDERSALVFLITGEGLRRAASFDGEESAASASACCIPHRRCSRAAFIV